VTTEPRDVLISTCGPSMRPYWPKLNGRYSLALTEKMTADGAKGQGWDATWIGDFVPKITDVGMFNVISQAMREVNWDEALAKFRWKGKDRDSLAQQIWQTVHDWGQISLGATLETGISIPWAIRYNTLQHIYNSLEEGPKGEWSCKAEEWVAGYVMKELVRILPNLFALDSLKAQRKVIGMVLHEDMSNDCAYFAMWARANKVPSVQIAHGAYGHLKERKNEDYDIHRQLIADQICVWNEGQQAYLLRGGVEPGRIHLTGHGMTDIWATLQPDREHAKKLLGLDPARPAVLYVSSWVNRLGPYTIEEELDRRFDTFLEGFKLTPNFQLVVRPHPGTHKWTPEWHAEQMRAHKVQGIVGAGELVPLVEAADVLFSPMNSMLDIEASIINRPGVTYCKDREPSRRGFYMLCEDDPQSVADSIQLTLGREKTPVWQEARNKQVYDSFYIVDGHAADRGLKVVYDTIERDATAREQAPGPDAPKVADAWNGATCPALNAVPVTVEKK
jgi:hypothetical protein